MIDCNLFRGLNSMRRMIIDNQPEQAVLKGRRAKNISGKDRRDVCTA